MRRLYVYIMSSRFRVLYTGITSNLHKRVFEHKTGALEGFTSKYKVTQLVCYESHDDVRTTINREKVIKGWPRKKKIELIESLNPKWKDLSSGWYDKPSDRRTLKFFQSRNARGGHNAI